MIKVDEDDPVGEMEPSFPFRDVIIKRGVDVKEFYDLEEEIGRGKFGTVYKCHEKGTNLTLAAKFVEIARRQDRRNVEREVEIMRTLQHPRLIQLYDAFETDNIMCVVLELIDGGELFERVINDDFVLTEKACTVFMRQICEGVEFIHSNNVIHLDLKPENILCLTKTGNRIKIIDFGLARKYEPDKKLQVLFGTPEFVSPEVVNFEPISPATDMWSVGVICYVLLSGLSPFMGETDVETMANVTLARYDFEDECFNEISVDAKDFISKLLLKEKEDRLTAGECLSHPWLRRKSSPPPPSLDNTKENLKNFIERCVPISKKSIMIKDGLQEKPGVIEKIIKNEQQKIYPHLIANPKKEISLLTNAHLQENFYYNRDSAQFLSSIDQTFKENENIINSRESDSIAKTLNIHEINIKNKVDLSPTVVKNPQVSNQTFNRNYNSKNDINVSSWNAKEKSEEINHVFDQLRNLKGMIPEKKISTDKSTSNQEFIDKSTFNNISIKSEITPNENKIFETKPQNTEQSNDNIELCSNLNVVSSVRSNYIEPIEGPSSLQDNQQNVVKLSTNESKINKEAVVCHSLCKRQEENFWFQKHENVNTLLTPSFSTQSTKDNIQKMLNNYKQEDSSKLIDFSKVSDFIQGSLMKLSENDKIPDLNLTKTLKEVESLPFKHHLKSNPPWFSELNNQHLKNPMTDRSERRSSDFSCFLNSKDDSASLNLADEIRKLSAKLLQMSKNQNVGSYTIDPPNSRVRNDPITCFLENHGISQPRQKYKFSNLNRDVPLGSPPPPSNIAYYLNMNSNVDRKDSHSDPGSPRTSPEKTDTSTNLNLQSRSDTSSSNIKRESVKHITVHPPESDLTTKAEFDDHQFDKGNTK